MARRIPLNERPALIRDPADWATDWGWVSRRRAQNIAAKLEELARTMEETIPSEDPNEPDVGEIWAKYVRDIARKLAPPQTPAERKIAAQRER